MLQINLSGKIAVVTGASGELGRVMVRTLASCGADVAIHYLRNQEKASELAKEVESMGKRTTLVQANVTIQDEVFTMRDKISSTLGVPHIIVNNAVIQYNWTNVLNQEVKDYESQFQSCVLHNVLMAKAFVPAMIDENYGRVIGINTECAMQTFEGQSAYVSGKRGMDGVLRVLAKEVGKHQITVNQVAPGWTISDKDRQSGLKRQEGYESKVPLNRRGTDQEIANVVAFLASDLASYITGVYIPVCGGNVMPRI
ncbi:TPA: short-chain dehydrogenase [Candidatus Poribacteria bacterium]|nr:short-chain dehydrogenase [Candidatus Poribacteria bacterium]